MTRPMDNPLQQILAPRSIAVLGASRDAGKRGNLAIRYLQQNQFQGAIYPVHPKETEVLGLACYPTVESLPEAPDLALICTAANTLPELVRRCGSKGIRGAVVLATGFSETGEVGLALENEMVRAARESGLRIIGPNTSGMFNTHCGANLVGYRDLRTGSIGLLSQSGNMALSLVTEGGQHATLGFSTYVGVGNEADVQFHEYLDYFAADPHTRVIVGYVEGLKQGRRFLQSAASICLEKPLVIYLSGRTAVGQQSARSHTGALAGSYEMAKGVMRQAGVLLVERADEILPVASTLASTAEWLPLNGNRVAILADGGGHATIAADALHQLGLSIPSLSETTRQQLRSLLPPAAAINNPVDVAGGTDNHPQLFADCAEVLLADSRIDALLIVGLFGGYALRFSESLAGEERQCAERLARLPGSLGKPLLLQSLYRPLKPEPLRYLESSNIPLFSSIDEAARCLAAVVNYSEAKKRLSIHDQTAAADPSIPVSELIFKVLQAGRSSLYEYEALDALAAYGAKVVVPQVIRDEEGFSDMAPSPPDLRYVMKLVSRDILHKTDAGGVKLDLMRDDFPQAYHEILANALRYQADARIEGVLLVPMAEPGVEVIIGVTQDRQFGPVMMFGLGGVFVEVLRDVVFRTLPLRRADALEMLDGIRGSKVLDGIRGGEPVDRQALVSLMLAVSDLCMNHPEIVELDLNPVLARPGDYCVLDARVLLNPQQEAA
ncbi:acetate--CoA ligase family protein [Sedimenticola selenatireducens]|uniref:acetate--CoA ligase family protein n=1 Tax=Sedimenticola selenatireducens TaxID=191960 RepID=UPI002AAB4674|nr:acetate--CoA ligase family protein [Sedimenticola selenatireducens]